MKNNSILLMELNNYHFETLILAIEYFSYFEKIFVYAPRVAKEIELFTKAQYSDNVVFIDSPNIEVDAVYANTYEHPMSFSSLTMFTRIFFKNRSKTIYLLTHNVDLIFPNMTSGKRRIKSYLYRLFTCYFSPKLLCLDYSSADKYPNTFDECLTNKGLSLYSKFLRKDVDTQKVLGSFFNVFSNEKIHENELHSFYAVLGRFDIRKRPLDKLLNSQVYKSGTKILFLGNSTNEDRLFILEHYKNLSDRIYLSYCFLSEPAFFHVIELSDAVLDLSSEHLYGAEKVSASRVISRSLGKELVKPS